MRFDIVIPTYNRAALLRECLESVLRSTSTVDWRVTVVDNNSSDDTKQVVESFAARNDRVGYLFEKVQGKSFALNRAIATSASDLIGMIDDDEQIRPDWIETAAKWMENSEVDFIGGPCFGLWRAEKPAWAPDERVISAKDPEQIPKTPVRFSDNDQVFVLGGNAVVRRSVFERVGLYRTDLGPGSDFAWSEDVEMFTRLMAAGLTGYYVPELVIYHVVTPERMTRAYYRRWVWGQAKSSAAIYRTNPQKVVHVGKVPRYMIGIAVKALPALVSSDPAKRFSAELEWWKLAGFTHGVYARARESRTYIEASKKSRLIQNW